MVLSKPMTDPEAARWEKRWVGRKWSFVSGTVVYISILMILIKLGLIWLGGDFIEMDAFYLVYSLLFGLSVGLLNWQSRNSRYQSYLLETRQFKRVPAIHIEE